MSSGEKYLNEAYQAIYQNDFRKAILLFKKAIMCEPDNPILYHKLSITYSRNGDIINALKAAQKACKLSDNQTYYYHLQIIQAKYLVYLASDKIDENNLSEEVESMLRKAIGLDPLNIEAYLLLGIYYGEKKRYIDAIEIIDSALKLDPFSQNAMQIKRYLIKLYKEGGENE